MEERLSLYDSGERQREDYREHGLASLLVAVGSERQERCRKSLRGSLQYLNNQVKYTEPFYSDSCIIWALASMVLFLFQVLLASF